MSTRRPGVVTFENNNVNGDVNEDPEKGDLAELVHLGNRSPGDFEMDTDFEAHDIFAEMDVINLLEEEWQERARWIKYEQRVEESAGRWGKPHVSSLSFHSLLELRKCIEFGTVLLDVEDEVLPEILTKIAEQMVEDRQLHELDEGIFKWTLQLKHRYLRPGQTLRNLTSRRKISVKPQKRERRASTVNPRARGISTVERPKPKLSTADNPRQRAISLGQADNQKLLLDTSMVSAKSDEELTDLERKERAIRNWQILRNNLDKISGRGQKMDFTRLVSELMELNEAEKFLKFVPEGSEAGVCLVGEVDFVEHAVSAFVRLSQGREMGLQLAEVPLPVRFIFIYLVPEGFDKDPMEVGRAMGTMFSNPKFKYSAYGSSAKKDLVLGLDTFMEDSLVLPTGQEYDEETLMPILQNILKKGKEVKATEARMRKASMAVREFVPEELEYEESPLKRTRKLFGGLIREVKKRYPKYLSDIKDALNTQCLGAIIFIYFAVLAPSITFGGLLSEKTDTYLGVSETFLMTSICGLIFAIFAGQPLVIVGVTGPMLVFEEALYQICGSFGVEFLPFHFWVGVWLAVIATLVVAFEGSCLLRYVSRFTQDIFALLISLIFIFESLKKLYLVFKSHPLLEYYPPSPTADPSNTTYDANAPGGNASVLLTTLAPAVQEKIVNQPNTAFFSLFLCLGTFWLASTLKAFKTSHYLGKTARRTIGDFSIPLAIICMVVLDILIRPTYTEKLFVPNGFKPTNDTKRGWLVNPLGMEESLPIWAVFLAIVPAILAFILLFMEEEITNLIVHKNLTKGSGYHIDINLLGLFGLVGGTLGLPFLCGATVRSVTHLNALCVYSKTYAPGEKPKLEYVIEQRITAICVYILLGVSILLGPVLTHVPTSVLFGVFLYMGVASLNGIQFWDRILLLFTPVKHHPDVGYVRRVRTFKMHLFTIIQFLILVVLWIVKSTKASLAFPFLLILCVPLRKFLLPVFYSKKELCMLDADEDNVELDEDEDEPLFHR